MSETKAMKELLDYEGAERRLGVKRATLYAWVSTRRLPFVKFGRRCVRFDPDVLDAWVESHRVDSTGSKEGK